MSDQLAEPAMPTPESDGASRVQNDTEVNLARRRWLTGVLAGPAVVSLPNTASALAMGSLSTCVENQYSHQNIPLFVTVSGFDTFTRAHIMGRRVSTANGKETAVVVIYPSGDVYDEYYKPWTPMGTGGKGEKFMSPTGDTYWYQAGNDVDCWTLAFTDGGNMSLEPDSQMWDYVPVTTSCWVSIAPIRL